jgi:membrane fusion protein (multidrug efflux system)
MYNAPVLNRLSTVLLATVLFAACTASDEETAKPVVLPLPHTPTFVIQKGRLSTGLHIPAELTAYREVDLYAKVDSYVKELKVDVGSVVEKGQLLAVLEAPELLSRLAASESRYKAQQAIFTQSDATYKRMLAVSKVPGTISKNDVDVAEAKRNSDEAQLEAAKAEFMANMTITNYLRIYAPFDGIISSRNVNLGAYTGPSGKGSAVPIFTLNEQTHLRLIFEVPEAYKGYINLADTVHFTVRAFPDQMFAARIARRAGVMDAQLRSEHIELDVLNEDRRLSPGMVAEANIKLSGNDNAFVVPRTALVNAPQGTFLIKDSSHDAVHVPVRPGRITDSLAEVFGSGLREGDSYVLKASEEIHSGAKIN